MSRGREGRVQGRFRGVILFILSELRLQSGYNKALFAELQERGQFVYTGPGTQEPGCSCEQLGMGGGRVSSWAAGPARPSQPWEKGRRHSEHDTIPLPQCYFTIPAQPSLCCLPVSPSPFPGGQTEVADGSSSSGGGAGLASKAASL